jgi:hypothetical protein
VADRVVEVARDACSLLGRGEPAPTLDPLTPKTIADVGNVLSPIPTDAMWAASSAPTTASVRRFAPALVAAKRKSAIVAPTGGPGG